MKSLLTSDEADQGGRQNYIVSIHSRLLCKS